MPPEEDPESSRWQDPIETCKHIFEIRRRVCSNGVVQFCEQCILCGLGRPSISHSSLTTIQRKVAQPYDTELQELVRRAAWEDRRTQREETRPQGWWTWYDEYLRSPVWQRKRAAVLKRCRGVCEACGQDWAIEVHHLTYAHVGGEPLWDLVGICVACHEWLHGQVKP